jgi:hypothetical protein
MRLTPNQITELVAEPDDARNSMLHSLYAKVQRGDLPPRATKPQPRGGRPAIFFDLSDACSFKLLYELGRIGLAAGTPVNRAALHALNSWSTVRPKIAHYKTPIEWAIEHIRAGGDVALAIYSCRKDGLTGIVAVLFDTEDPIIPDGCIVRIALSLADLLLPVLRRAEALKKAH